MRVAETAKLFGGSVVVYFVVAACSAAYSEEPQAPGVSSGGPSASTPALPSPVPDALAEGHKSGSRLRLHFWEGSDGSRQFIDFYDTQLQTICTVSGVRTSDGKVRCLPAVTGTLFYGDAQCKSPVLYAVSKSVDPQPKVAAIETSSQGNAGAREHFSLTSLINPPGALFSAEKGTTCSPTAAPAGLNLYGVGAPLAPTEFIEMSMKTE